MSAPESVAELIREVCGSLADEPCPEQYGGDYLFCLRVERVINNEMEMEIPWQDIHREVKEWLVQSK